MKRSRHPFVAFVLAMLVVGVQYGSQLHALGHAEESLKNGPDRSFSLPDDEACSICALFAGGANGLADAIDIDTAVFVGEEHVLYAPPLPARTAPRFYDSRAPPAFL